jgi:mannan endo-1,4-beta-mannosidase
MSVSQAAIDAPDVDIVGGHFYPVDVAWMQRDAATAAAHGKAYVVGEFSWTNASATNALISAVQSDPDISGDLYWTLMPHLANGDPEPHGDGYAMYAPGVDQNSAAVGAALTSHARWMSAQH